LHHAILKTTITTFFKQLETTFFKKTTDLSEISDGIRLL